MNKWLARLLGAVILLLLILVLGDKWFNPAVSPILELEGEQPPAAAVRPPPAQPQAPPPEISLTSLQDMESDKGAPPPVLTNPQGNPEAQPKAPQSVPPVPELTLSSLDDVKEAERAPVPEKKPQPKPDKAKASKPAAPAEEANVFVQAGAFGERSNAEQLAAGLRKNGFDAVISEAVIQGRKFNRVFIGPMAESQVNDVLQKLSRMGINARQVKSVSGR